MKKISRSKNFETKPSYTMSEKTSVKIVVTLPEELVSSRKAAQNNEKKGKPQASTSSTLDFELNKETPAGAIRSYLGLTEQTKYLPSYSLVSAETGDSINDETLVGEIGNGTIPQVTLKLELAPYNTKSSIMHVLRLRNDFGFTNELEDDISEIAISSGSSFQELQFTEKNKADVKPVSGDNSEAKPQELKKTFAISDEEKAKFNAIIADTLEQTLPITEFLANTETIVTPVCRGLNFSQYNPVPSLYKSRGHTVYLQVVTWEAETLHVTGSSNGFFLNKSNSNKFDPNAKDELSFVTLYDLINHYSKKFSQHVQEFNNKLSSVPMVSYIKPNAGVLNKPWLIKPSVLNNYGDYFRMQHSDLLPFENKISFNTDFQTIKDLDANDLQTRVTMERSLVRIVDVFTKSAIKGAMKIFNGEMDPYMPTDAGTGLLSQTFFEDEIFYSFVKDINDTHSEKGGDEYMYSMANSDLRATKSLHKINPVLMRYRLMCIVDYCGKRVLCEAPVAGLMTCPGAKFIKNEKTGNPEPTEESMSDATTVIYGSVANAEEKDGQTIVYDAEFNDSLEEIAKSMHLKPHVIDGNEFKVSCTSSGLVGTDKRKYLVNLNNLAPSDINFIAEHFDQVTDPAKKYPHSHAKLRHELVDSWWSIKTEGADIEKAFEEYQYSFNTDDAKDPASKELSDFLNEKVIPTFLKEVLDDTVQLPFDGDHLIESLHKSGINVRYLYKVIALIEEEYKFQVERKDASLKEVAAANVEHKEYEVAVTTKLEKMIQERQKQINKLIQEGKQVPEELKMENMKIDPEDIRKPTTEQPVMIASDKLFPLKKLCQLEIVARSLKHIFRKYSRDIPTSVVPTLISHFYNLLFGKDFNSTPAFEFLDSFYAASAADFEFTKVSREELLEEVISQAAIRFRYDFSLEDLEKLLTTKPFVLIRNLNKKFGIQMVNRGYYFNTEEYNAFLAKQDKKTLKTLTQQTAVFSAKDFSVIPVVKDSEYVSGLVSQFWNSGAIILGGESEGKEPDINEALGLFNEAVSLREEFYGFVHQSVGEMYLRLSSIHTKLNELEKAIVLARKAVVIFERTCGMDSFLVVRALLNLIFLETANDCPYNAMQLCQRVMQIAEACTFNEHPILIDILNNMQKLSIGCKETKQTIQILNKINYLIETYNGGKNCAYAINLSSIANLHASRKELANSLKTIQEAFDIFTVELGLRHQFTATADQWAQSLKNVVESQRAQSRASAAQNAALNGSASGSAPSNKKKSKQDKQAAELNNKSVEELVNFVEGDSKGKNSKKGKK